MKIQIRGITRTEKYKQPGEFYWKLETDKGDMSCFEAVIADKLYEAWKANKEIEVDTKASDDGKYVNIRGTGSREVPDEPGRTTGAETFQKPETTAEAHFRGQKAYEERNRNYEATHPKETPYAGMMPSKPQDSEKKTSGVFNPTSMYVSYAKDIFIAIRQLNTEITHSNDSIMIGSIELVKQAHKAFS